MTEKEKAKAYDEAIEGAKKSYGNGITEGIFPELKESDDEKIRRWIIDDIRCNMNNEPLNNSEYKKKLKRLLIGLKSNVNQILIVAYLLNTMVIHGACAEEIMGWKYLLMEK